MTRRASDEQATPNAGGDDPAEAIWQALDENDVGRALALARSIQPLPDMPELQLAVSAAHVAAGELETARRMLRGMERLAFDGDQEFERISQLAEVLYRSGCPEEALTELFKLEPADRAERAELAWRTGLCHDHAGRPAKADACFRDAARLGGDTFPAPVAITPEEMERVVKLVVARLPEKVRATLDEVPVIIRDLPAPALVRGSKGEIDPDTLGLYTGQNLMERSVLDPAPLPAEILLFRRNLERFATDRPELIEEVERTLLHELGHHLGYEEEGLDQLGLG